MSRSSWFWIPTKQKLDATRANVHIHHNESSWVSFDVCNHWKEVEALVLFRHWFLLLLLFVTAFCCCSSQFVVAVVRCWSLEVNVDYLSLLFLVCLLVRLHCCCTSLLFVVIVVAQKRLVSTNSGGYPNNMTIRGVFKLLIFFSSFSTGKMSHEEDPLTMQSLFQDFHSTSSASTSSFKKTG